MIQKLVYLRKETNIAKKLREMFKAYFNTFFSTFTVVYISKVINFAVN